MSAIYKRELRSYFSSPLGYAILAALAFFSGLFFVFAYSSGYGDIAYIFSNQFTIIMFAVPILTMRLMSEERKQKTDQALLTAPVSLWGIVLGKFFAAFTIYALAFAPTFIFQLIFAANISTYSVNWLIYISVLLGVLLYGAALISIGLFISSLTESQVVSAVLGIVASLLIGLMDSFASMFGNATVTKLVEYISFSARYETFSIGIIDISNIIFFVSIVGAFTFLTVRMLEKRRWA